jgi:Secretion system C-terminal sorting domain
MKKILLISLCTYACINATAQHTPIGSRQHLSPNAKAISIDALLPGGGNDNVPLNSNPALNFVAPTPSAKTFHTITETSIGLTDYDLQTNESIMNRLLKHPDGTISATWTFAPVGSATGFPLRGTGYNYFDGTSWGPVPTSRIEPINRSGWPNIVVTASGKEVAIAHSNTLAGILQTDRPAKGTGIWTEQPTSFGQNPNDTWAKAIAGGSNGQTIHSICQGSGLAGLAVANQRGPLFYSRSNDEGVTWPILRTVIPDTDSSHYLGFSSDSYAIDTKGDTVAIVLGSFLTDLLLLKSFDNGTSWTSQVIQPFFQPFYDASVDSFPDLNGNGSSADDLLEGPSGDACVLIDRLGKVNVWWSNVLQQDSSAASPVFFFPNSLDGLLYWNDGFAPGQAPDTIAFAQDGINANGVLDIPQTSLGGGNGIGSYRGSITQMPSAGVDASNNIYVSYQSFCEDCDTTAFNTGHKHIYMIATADQGANWSIPIDIDQTPDVLNQEDVFACVAKNVDINCIHVIYQRDGAPGHKVSTNTTEAGWNSSPSEIIYACVPPNSVFVKQLSKNENLNLSQNFPNPSSGLTSISFTIRNTKSKVNFELRDVLGNVVYAEDKGTLNAGTYSFDLNTKNYAAGVYFYSLKVNEQSTTKKLMIE